MNSLVHLSRQRLSTRLKWYGTASRSSPTREVRFGKATGMRIDLCRVKESLETTPLLSPRPPETRSGKWVRGPTEGCRYENLRTRVGQSGERMARLGENGIGRADLGRSLEETPHNLGRHLQQWGSYSLSRCSSLASLASHATRPDGEFDPENGPGKSIIVRSEVVRLWLPEALAVLAKRRSVARGTCSRRITTISRTPAPKPSG